MSKGNKTKKKIKWHIENNEQRRKSYTVNRNEPRKKIKKRHSGTIQKKRDVKFFRKIKKSKKVSSEAICIKDKHQKLLSEER